MHAMEVFHEFIVNLAGYIGEHISEVGVLNPELANVR